MTAQRYGGPRAHSIVALGLTTQTRRFLMKLGIKTVDALTKIDRDFLACNGASDSIVAEIEARMNDLTATSDECTGKQESNVEEKESLDQILTDMGFELRDEPNAAIDDKSSNGSEEQNPSGDETIFAGLMHTTIADLAAALGTPEYDLEEDEEAFRQDLAQRLLLPENEKLVVHSSDKSALKLAAHAAGLAYEDMVAHQSEVEYLYSLPVSNLPLSVRTSNILSRQNCQTIGDLCAMGEERLISVRNAGVGVIQNVKEALATVDERLVPIFESGKGRETEPDPDLFAPSASAALLAAPSLKEAPLDFDSLSVRAQHCLKIGGLTTVGEVLELGEEGLLNLRNAGLKTVDEILIQANAQAEAYMAAHPEEDKGTKTPILEDSPPDDPASESEQESVSEEASDIRVFLVDVSEYALISPLLAARLVKSGVSAEDVASRIVESLVADTLGRNPWGLTDEEIATRISQYDNAIAPQDVIAILQAMSEANRASSANGIWHLDETSIEDAVATRIEKDDWRAMVVGRLSGKTLEEIGDSQGVTRERVRQITAKAMDEHILDGTRAGRYLGYMRRYELDEREVRFGLGATVIEWEAASLVKKTQCKDDPIPLPAEALLSDKSIPSRVRLSLEKEIHHGYVKIDGDYVKEKRLDLMLYALKRYASKQSIGDEEFTSKYLEMLEELGIANKPDLHLSERYMSNFRLQKCVLSGYWTRVRYYDFDKFDVHELVGRLGFEDFEGKEISTRVFLATKPDLLKEFEIDDAYELHSLLRSISREAEKTGEELPYSMTRRMPIIRVGETDREQQVIELAQELSPISIDDFATAYEEEYGVEQASVKGDYIKFIGDYVVNSVISMDLEPFTDEEAARMSELFPGDFYKLSRFEKAYRHEFPDAGTQRLNALSMRSIGFKVYASCIMRDTWVRQSNFFDSLILGGEFFNEQNVSEDISSSHPYEVYIDNLVRERRLLPYEGDTWITEKGLEELGITDAMMLDFAEKAASFCEERGLRYCTAQSLRSVGFGHDLFAYELSDEFYAALLCTSGTRFSVLLCSRMRIACLDDAHVAVASFLEAQVGEGESLAVEDLALRVQEDFGITVRRDKVIYAPNRSDLYYSPITDMIYKDRQTFIKEVE